MSWYYTTPHAISRKNLVDELAKIQLPDLSAAVQRQLEAAKLAAIEIAKAMNCERVSVYVTGHANDPERRPEQPGDSITVSVVESV